MTPDLSLKVTNYIKTNGLTFSPRADVLSRMVAEGVITQSEYEEIINGNIYSHTPTDNETTIGDHVIISQTTTDSTPIEFKETKAHHPVFKELELNQNGKINMSQFSADALRSKYDNDKYEIIQSTDEDEESITVINKESEIPVESIIISKDEYDVPQFMKCTHNANGDITSALNIRNGNIQDFIEYNADGTFSITTYNDGDISKISSKAKYNTDGSSIITKYISPNVTIVANYNSDDEMISCEKYVNGKKYAKCDKNENVTENYILEELFRQFNKDTKDYKPLIEFITNNINEHNIGEIIKDYYALYNEHFFSIIESSAQITPEQQKYLLNYFYETMSKTGNDDKATQQLKNNLALAYIEDNPDDLNKYIKQTNSENILSVAKAFGSFSSEDKESIVGKRTFYSLLSIIETSSMPDKEKQSCRKHLVDNLISYAEKHKIYCADIKRDIYSHIDDSHKFNIDYKRLVARVDSTQDTEDITPPDGKINLDYSQGGVCDCWLITGLKSISQKVGGKDIINNLLSVDNNNKTVTVTFPKVGKSYTISFDEITQSNHLAKGDADVRAIEIAIDRYKKELAYQNTDEINPDYELNYSDDYDINNDTTEFLYQLILGEGSTIDDIDIETWIPEDENIPMTFTIEDDNNVSAMDMNTQNTFRLDTNHAYILDSADEENIYIVDPRQKGYEKIIVKRNNLLNSDISVEVGKNPAKN